MQPESPAPDVGNGMLSIPDRFISLMELKDCLEALPLLRAPRIGLDPGRAVVACHIDDLDEAVAYYQQHLTSLPAFYVLGLNAERKIPLPAQANLHAFSELEQGMDIQLYFRQHNVPLQTAYPLLAAALRQRGITRYFLELSSTEKFYRRHRKEVFSDADWDVVLNFANRLHDAESRHAYLAVCRARTDAEPGHIPLAAYPQYRHPLVPIVPGDIICEGGCYTDDNVENITVNFLEALGGNGRIVCFEPVVQTFQHLKRIYAAFPAITLEQKALWSCTGHISLTGNGASAAVDLHAPDATGCPCTSIDDYFSDVACPTVIKLDVEGAEPAVLQGARHTLKNGLPKLMLSIYHSRSGKDWITIPRMLLDCDLPYDYFCGHHQPWYAETIVYAKKTVQENGKSDA